MMKKIFVTVSKWLRSIVTTISKGEWLRVNNDVNLPIKQTKKQSSLAEGESSPLLVRMEEYVEEHYAVRFNRLSQHYELSPLGTERWAKLDEETIYRLMMEMNHAGICITKPYLVRAVVQGGELMRMYHPVNDYLESLPQWDGTPHIEALFRRVTDDETGSRRFICVELAHAIE